MSHAEAIAWLASPNNKDAELREQAKVLLAKLLFLYEYEMKTNAKAKTKGQPK